MAKQIAPHNNWTGMVAAAFTEKELLTMFAEIAEYRRTGILADETLLRRYETRYRDETGDEGVLALRLLEDTILFEISRRYYNQNVSR